MRLPCARARARALVCVESKMESFRVRLSRSTLANATRASRAGVRHGLRAYTLRTVAVGQMHERARLRSLFGHEAKRAQAHVSVVHIESKII